MVVPLSKDFELKVNPRVAAAVAAGLVVLGTAVLAIARVNGNSGWSQGGPLIVPNPHAYVVRHRVGDVFTDGLERIKLEGTQPGVLRRVEITGPGADHFKVLGVLLAGPHRRIEAWEVAPGFPPRIHGQGPTPLGRLVPAQGALLATGKVGMSSRSG